MTTIKEIEKEFDNGFFFYWWLLGTSLDGDEFSLDGEKIKSFYRTQILSLLDELKMGHITRSYIVSPTAPKDYRDFGLEDYCKGWTAAVKELNTRIDKIKGELK